MFEDFDHTVLHFMNEWGSDFQYIRSVDGEYNPATGSTSSTEKKFLVRGIMMDMTLQSNGLGTRYGTQILAGDKQFFMQPPNKATDGAPALVVNPTTDRIKLGNVLYSIVTFKEVNPTGADPIVFELVLRR
jgi:hypothetical protein